MDFNTRVSAVAFDTPGLSRKDLLLYREKRLPEFSLTDMIRITSSFILGYESDPDGNCFEDLEDEVYSIVTDYYEYKSLPNGRNLDSIIKKRCDSINNLAIIVSPPLIDAVGSQNRNFRSDYVFVCEGRSLGVGWLVSYIANR